MKSLIIMLIVVPIHIWEAKEPVVIPGWASIEACEAQAEAFSKRFGATNQHVAPWSWRKPLSIETVDDFVPAHVECVSLPNEEAKD